MLTNWSWKKRIANEAKRNGDSLENFTSTLTEDQLNHEYEPHEYAIPFRAWSDNYVYFSTYFVGNGFSVDSMPRNPCDNKVDEHMGNEERP